MNNEYKAVVIYGKCGAGKTTISNNLCKKLECPVFNIGLFREIYEVRNFIYEEVAWDILVTTIKNFLEFRLPFIYTTTGLNRKEKEIKKLLKGKTLKVHLVCSQRVLRERIKKRGKKKVSKYFPYSLSFNDINNLREKNGRKKYNLVLYTNRRSIESCVNAILKKFKKGIK